MDKTQEHNIAQKTEVVENYGNNLRTDWKTANRLLGDKYLLNHSINHASDFVTLILDGGLLWERTNDGEQWVWRWIISNFKSCSISLKKIWSKYSKIWVCFKLDLIPFIVLSTWWKIYLAVIENFLCYFLQNCLCFPFLELQLDG